MSSSWFLISKKRKWTQQRMKEVMLSTFHEEIKHRSFVLLHKRLCKGQWIHLGMFEIAAKKMDFSDIGRPQCTVIQQLSSHYRRILIASSFIFPFKKLAPIFHWNRFLCLSKNFLEKDGAKIERDLLGWSSCIACMEAPTCIVCTILTHCLLCVE